MDICLNANLEDMYQELRKIWDLKLHKEMWEYKTCLHTSETRELHVTPDSQLKRISSKTDPLQVEVNIFLKSSSPVMTPRGEVGSASATGCAAYTPHFT